MITLIITHTLPHLSRPTLLQQVCTSPCAKRTIICHGSLAWIPMFPAMTSSLSFNLTLKTLGSKQIHTSNERLLYDLS